MHRRLADLEAAQLRRQVQPLLSQGMLLTDALGNQLVNFGSNDYLGFGSQPLTLSETGLDRREATGPSDQGVALENTIRRGSGASGLVCGYSRFHDELASRLATLEETEAAALYPSGYAACSGSVTALAQRGDLILSDALNHASLIDGCRLSKAERFVYPHGDADAVEALLRNHRRRFANAWIVTDSIFSMDGTLASLQRLVEIADAHDATLVVDEAHATGVLGDDGSGLCAALGLKTRVPIRIGTLSKAIGSQGGFVVGPQVVIDYLLNHSRPLIYSTAATPASVTAALASLRSISQDPRPRERVRQHSQRVRAGLRQMGFSTPELDSLEATIPIVPVRLGDASAALRAATMLRAHGCYVPAIRPPTVPPGTSRLRISLSAAHSEAQIDQLLAGLRQLRR